MGLLRSAGQHGAGWGGSRPTAATPYGALAGCAGNLKERRARGKNGGDDGVCDGDALGMGGDEQVGWGVERVMQGRLISEDWTYQEN